MSNENIYDGITGIREDIVQKVENYQFKKKENKKSGKKAWMKWGAMAACACLVVGSGYGVSKYFENYVKENGIELYSDSEYSDSISSADVTQEQAERISLANDIHGILTTQNYAWYGGCYYDFADDGIIVGLTEISDVNKEMIISQIGEIELQFRQCDFTYQHLEKVYSKIDEKRTFLMTLGVERYNISVENNCVNVYVRDADSNAAICIVNEMDDIGGAIRFRTDKKVTDSGLKNVENPVYEVVRYEVPDEYDITTLYIATTNEMESYDQHMVSKYDSRVQGKGIRVFSFVEGTINPELNVWYLVYEGEHISKIYYISKSPKSDGEYLTGWMEAGELGCVLEALSGMTSKDEPMYLAQDDEIIYAIIGKKAYYLPVSVFEPAVSHLPEMDLDGLEVTVIELTK